MTDLWWLPSTGTPKSSGWVVKSKEGGFSSDGNFADLALEDGFEMGDGLSLRDLEDRNAALRNEIEAAKEKVRREMERREGFCKKDGGTERRRRSKHSSGN